MGKVSQHLVNEPVDPAIDMARVEPDHLGRHLDAARAYHTQLGQTLDRIERIERTHGRPFFEDVDLAERYARRLERALRYAVDAR